MDHKTAGNRKNKYLIPIVIVLALLIAVVAMLVAVVLGQESDDSVSKGNVVGSQSTSAVANFNTSNTSALALRRITPVTTLLTNAESSEKITISRWSNFDAERSFTVSNMMPGDVKTKEYTLKINSNDPQRLIFDVEITETSVLEEKLTITVKVGEQTLYSGLLADAKQIEYDMTSVTDTEIVYTLFVGLPKDANNRYANKTLKANFIWTLEEEEEATPPSPPSGPTTVIYPIEPTSFDNIKITVNKSIEGDTYEGGEGFTFALEYLDPEEGYVNVGMLAATKEGSYAFSDAMSSFVFKKVGLFEFRIVEKAGSAEGMTYDSSEKVFQIYVDDSEYDNDGKLEIFGLAGVSGVSVAYDEETGRYDLAVSFTNSYEKETEPIETDPPDTDPPETDPPVPDDVEVVIKAENVIANDETGVVDAEGFVFAIENVETGEKQFVLTDKNGIAEFRLKYTVDDVGKTFTYKVYALAGGDAEIEYSTEVYEITVTISQNAAGELVATITVNGVTVPEEDVRLSFTTTYVGAPRELDSLIPAIIITAIILILEIVWFIYKKNKDKKEEKEDKNDVKLASFASPVVFLGLFVPLWQVVVLLTLVTAAIAMLAVNIVYYVRARKNKKEEEAEKDTETEQSESE